MSSIHYFAVSSFNLRDNVRNVLEASSINILDSVKFKRALQWQVLIILLSSVTKINVLPVLNSSVIGSVK